MNSMLTHDILFRDAYSEVDINTQQEPSPQMVAGKDTGMSDVDLQAENDAGKDFCLYIWLDGDRLGQYAASYSRCEGSVL